MPARWCFDRRALLFATALIAACGGAAQWCFDRRALLFATALIAACGGAPHGNTVGGRVSSASCGTSAEVRVYTHPDTCPSCSVQELRHERALRLRVWAECSARDGSARRHVTLVNDARVYGAFHDVGWPDGCVGPVDFYATVIANAYRCQARGVYRPQVSCSDLNRVIAVTLPCIDP